jgi:TonB-dependent Receptor Plug Domain/TonB dependent receptor-like, beta-barrel
MNLVLLRCLALLCAACVFTDAAAAGSALSERDYFEDLPVVLSVSRLAQPLDETPGAVTVIDRETLRRLGARDIYDALRLVPGFVVSGWNGASPVAAYHDVLDQVGQKLQVFIDGRSVYSTYYLGGTQRGLQGVILEDVERIEVLRGSDSAAYGANAFLGVINIVTRHSADTRGLLASVSSGNDGIDDNTVRYGWGNDDASFRVSMSRRADHGLEHVYDDSHIGLMNLRADLRPTTQDDIMLQAGNTENSWGDGVAASNDPSGMLNPQRTVSMRSWFMLGQWHRVLGGGEDMKLSFSYDDEDFRDRAPYGNPNPFFQGVVLDWSGQARRTQLEFQHSFTPAPTWRMVWGTTLRDERVRSLPLYYQQDWLAAQQWRLFGNLEWRPEARWVVNAGATWEKSSLAGGALAPRLAVNFHLLPGQTLRAGVTKSRRLPTLFEEKADVRFFNAEGMQVAWTWDMRGDARPENLLVREIGYLGEFRPLGLSVDVRGFDEIMTDALVTSFYFNGVTYVTEKTNRTDALNMSGYEYQLRWRPTATTQIWWSHMTMHCSQPPLHAGMMVSIVPGLADATGQSSPRWTDSLALFQSLPGNYDLTLTYSAASAMTWNAPSDLLPAQHRTDVRLAKRFRIGSTRAEAALTVQAADGAYQQFLPGRVFDRRAFATLRLEY